MTRRKLIVAEVTWKDRANDDRKAGDPIRFDDDWWKVAGIPAPERWGDVLPADIHVELIAEKELMHG